MKSKITIEIDHDNQPIIRIAYEYSPDVRDTLVKRFLESFGSDACWSKFYYDNHDPNQPNKHAILRPICAVDLPEEAKVMNAAAQQHLEIQNGFPQGTFEKPIGPTI